MADDRDAPGYTYDELLAEKRSWETVAQQMNRKLLAIMDVLDEMKQAESYEVRDAAERILRII